MKMDFLHEVQVEVVLDFTVPQHKLEASVRSE